MTNQLKEFSCTEQIDSKLSNWELILGDPNWGGFRKRLEIEITNQL
jgi:hypothetical protein